MLFSTIIINLNFQKYLFSAICIKVQELEGICFKKYSKLFQLDQEKIETILLDNSGS